MEGLFQQPVWALNSRYPAKPRSLGCRCPPRGLTPGSVVRKLVRPITEKRPDMLGAGSRPMEPTWGTMILVVGLISALTSCSREGGESVQPAQSAPPAQPARRAMELTSNWRFHLGEAPEEVTAASFDDSGWESVTVPHTWNRLGEPGSVRTAATNNQRGIGWYRLRFAAPAAQGTQRNFLQFDAAGSLADVWLNGTKLGTHAGAFSRFPFRCDGSVATRRAESSRRQGRQHEARAWRQHAGHHSSRWRFLRARRPVSRRLADHDECAACGYAGLRRSWRVRPRDAKSGTIERMSLCSPDCATTVRNRATFRS